MPAENLELAREMYERWNAGDVEAIATAVPPDFVFHMHGRLPDMPELIEGPDGMRRLYAVWYSGPWEGSLRMDVERLVEVDGERVLGLITFRGTGSGSGAAVSIRYSHLLTIRDGVTLRMDGFPGWRAGIEAAGLDSEELRRLSAEEEP